VSYKVNYLVYYCEQVQILQQQYQWGILTIHTLTPNWTGPWHIVVWNTNVNYTIQWPSNLT
jgi:hypothetical protein